jgi:uncharacterized protein with PQ loop repeat
MEFEQFGWNAQTISFIGAIVTSFIGFYGVIIQNRKIWKAKRAKSVNVTMMSYGTLFFAVGGIYGIFIHSWALMLMGLRTILQLPVLVGTWKFKGFTRIEMALCVVWFAVLAVFIAVPDSDLRLFGMTRGMREWIYLAVSLGTIISFIPQPVEMIKERDSGELSLMFLLSAWIGIGFWTVYSFAFGIWVLMVSNPIMFALVTITVVLWFAFRKKGGHE